MYINVFIKKKHHFYDISTKDHCMCVTMVVLIVEMLCIIYDK